MVTAVCYYLHPDVIINESLEVIINISPHFCRHTPNSSPCSPFSSQSPTRLDGSAADELWRIKCWWLGTYWRKARIGLPSPFMSRTRNLGCDYSCFLPFKACFCGSGPVGKISLHRLSLWESLLNSCGRASLTLFRRPQQVTDVVQRLGGRALSFGERD